MKTKSPISQWPPSVAESCEDHVVADLAIMADMAAVHEVAAVADPRHPPPATVPRSW
jgi:hypothetical protein